MRNENVCTNLRPFKKILFFLVSLLSELNAFSKSFQVRLTILVVIILNNVSKGSCSNFSSSFSTTFYLKIPEPKKIVAPESLASTAFGRDASERACCQWQLVANFRLFCEGDKFRSKKQIS